MGKVIVTNGPALVKDETWLGLARLAIILTPICLTHPIVKTKLQFQTLLALLCLALLYSSKMN